MHVQSVEFLPMKRKSLWFSLPCSRPLSKFWTSSLYSARRAPLPDLPRIGIRELRQRASRYIEQVRQSETIQVTDNGTLVAALIRVSEARTVRERLLRDGQLVAAQRSFQMPTPLPAKVGSPSNAQILDEVSSERF